MKILKKILKYLKHPEKIVLLVNAYVSGHLFSDRFYLKCAYKEKMGKRLNLDNPQTYNEKLQWLKLYDRKPEYTKMVDKYDVKEYISEKIGEEYIIPTLGIWNEFEEIDFDLLPKQFVLKCTHDSGGLVVCRDKSQLDIAAAREKINRCMKRNYFWHGREWPYKNVKPRIIAEEYLEDKKTSELRDYKFFTFNGTPKLLFIATERYGLEETKFDFFDMDFNHLNITNGHPNAKILPEKPLNFDKMKELAAKLSKNIPHLRVDFYEVDGKVYFGELTFFHWSGMVPFEPEEWDLKLGQWIDLNG
jgi:hypothetical protein